MQSRSFKVFKLLSTLIIVTILINSIIGEGIYLNQVDSSNSDIENNVKVDDYAEYTIKAHTYQQISSNGILVGNVGFFRPVKSGYLRWTVTGINNKNISLKIEVSIDEFYSATKQVVISHNIVYSEDLEPLGYIPLWISLESINETKSLNNIKFDGPINKPLIGQLDNFTHYNYFMNGIRQTMSFSNHFNYSTPGMLSGYYSVGAWTWYFSKYNGILVQLGDYFPLFWSTLEFDYKFSGSFILSKTNIKLGPIDQIKTFLHQFAPFIDLMIVVIPIVIFGAVIYLIKWKRSHHG